jgi:hypothetical protein
VLASNELVFNVAAMSVQWSATDGGRGQSYWPEQSIAVPKKTLQWLHFVQHDFGVWLRGLEADMLFWLALTVACAAVDFLPPFLIQHPRIAVA